MDFFEAEMRYLDWKKQYEGGQIDADTFEEWVNTIFVRGPDSESWHIGINTGLWYRLEGAAWVEDNPYKKYAAAASVEPPPPPLEAGRPPQAPLSPAPGAVRKSSTLTIVLVVLGVFICLGALAAGVLFAGLLPSLLSTPTPQRAALIPLPSPSSAAAETPIPLSTSEGETPLPGLSEEPPNPAGTALFEDDFSDETSGWQDIRVGENFDTLYFEGGYLIVVTTKGFTARADPGLDFPGGVRVEVEAVQNTGSPYDEYGLICHLTKNSDDTANYDYLAISSDGLGLIYRVDHDKKALLLTEPPGNRSDVIHSGKQINRLRADCLEDGSLALYVNGEKVASAVDTALSGGGVGLRADSEVGETEIRFDNFTVFQP